jgi:hypothetical protein
VAAVVLAGLFFQHQPVAVAVAVAAVEYRA